MDSPSELPKMNKNNSQEFKRLASFTQEPFHMIIQYSSHTMPFVFCFFCFFQDLAFSPPVAPRLCFESHGWGLQLVQ